VAGLLIRPRLRRMDRVDVWAAAVARTQEEEQGGLVRAPGCAATAAPHPGPPPAAAAPRAGELLPLSVHLPTTLKNISGGQGCEWLGCRFTLLLKFEILLLVN
jgi:hypothetical protein